MKPSHAVAALVLLGAFAIPRAAHAAECVWGQPGYKACVDDLLAKRKAEDERRGQQPPSQTFKTAPARNRAPALTPLAGPGQPQPVPRMPQGKDTTIDNQMMMDDAFARMKRDAARPAIMPQNRDLFQLPGRICPSQGC